jgi:hypothetical protein
MDRLEQAARQQAGELARVTTVGLDPVARPLRHQARRHHRTVDAASDQMPVETEARRARLVAAAHPRPATQHTLDRLLVMWQRPLLQQLLGAHRRQPDRARMDVQPNRHRRRRVVHGRRPPYVALPGPNPATHDKCVGADHSPTTTGHRARKGHGSILSKKPGGLPCGRPSRRRPRRAVPRSARAAARRRASRSSRGRRAGRGRRRARGARKAGLPRHARGGG